MIDTVAAESFINKEIDLHDGDLVLIGVETKKEVKKTNPYMLESLLGKLRICIWNYGQETNTLKPFEKIQSSSTPLQFLWVNNFPLFEYTSDGLVKSTHHPFTAPLDIRDIESMKTTDVMKLHSTGCDLVLNGNEIGGGFGYELAMISRSLRIHDYRLQHYIMSEILGIRDTSVVGIRMEVNCSSIIY